MKNIKTTEQEEYNIGDYVAIRTLNSLTVMEITNKIKNKDYYTYHFTSGESLKKETFEAKDFVGKVSFGKIIGSPSNKK